MGKCRCSLVICLYFFNGIINGVSFTVNLEEFYYNRADRSGIMEQVLFQEEGVAVRCTRNVCEFLNGGFPFRWIGRVYQHRLFNYDGLDPVLT